MKDTKLIRALKTLTKEEWRSFRKHLLSYTGSDSEIFSLFTIFQKNKNKLSELGDPKDFKKKHFPELTLKAFFVMSSKIYKCLEDWLALNEYKKEEYQKELFLIKALFNKGLLQEARAHADKLKTRLNSSEVLDLNIKKILAEIDHLVYYNVNKDSVDYRNKLLLSLSENFALSYKERSQFYLAELLNRKNFYRINYDKHIEDLKASHKFIPDSELIEVGNSVIQVMGAKDSIHLNKLIDTLLERKINAGSELESILKAYGSIGIRTAYGFGYFNDIKNLQPFFNFLFESDMENSSGKITNTRFHNTVDVLGNYLDMEQTLGFVDMWIDRIETPKPKETKDLAYAQIYFINRDFKKMMEYSNYIAFNNPGQRTRAWIHNLICMYIFRKENYDLVTHSLKAFKSYLRRNKQKYSINFFKSSHNIATIMEKLIKNDFTPQKINIQDYKKVFYKKWVTEEIEKAKKE